MSKPSPYVTPGLRRWEPVPKTVGGVLQYFEQRSGLTLAQLIAPMPAGPSTDKQRTRWRQVCAWWLRTWLDLSFGQIGDIMGEVDKSSARHLCTTVEGRMGRDAKYANWVSNLNPAEGSLYDEATKKLNQQSDD